MGREGAGGEGRELKEWGGRERGQGGRDGKRHGGGAGKLGIGWKEGREEQGGRQAERQEGSHETRMELRHKDLTMQVIQLYQSKNI